ncbi:Alpha/beta hydrolase fold-1 [Aspergillus californicus]
MSYKPTVVLVPGAWATPTFYDQLQSCLTERGIATEAVTHQSTGAEPPVTTLGDDVSKLHTSLQRLCDSGKDIIVVAHSYGGLVSSGAVEGLEKPTRQVKGQQGGVVMILYMTAFVLPKGLSILRASGGQLMPWIRSEGSYSYSTAGGEGSFHDLSPAEQSHWLTNLTHTSVSIFLGDTTHEPWHIIPTAYILGEEDRMLPVEMQEYMVKTLGTSQTYRLKASHFPFLSMPQKVADIVEEIYHREI